MSVLSLIYAAGLCQAVFLIAALNALPVRNRHALTLLQIFVLVFSILLAEILQVELHAGRSLGLGLAIEFALAPLLYLFVRALFRGDDRLSRDDAWHFAPLVAASAVLVWLNLGFPGEVSLSNPSMRSIVAGIAITKIGYFFLYMSAALAQPIASDASSERRRVLANLRRVLVAFAAVYAFTAASFIAFLARAPFMPDSDIVGGIVLAASLYAIGYFSLVNREIFDLRDPYAGAALPRAEASALRARALAFVDADERYREPELSLQKVAGGLGVSAAQLSQALNAAGEGGFNQLLNRMRLGAYLELRARRENEGKTVLELAHDAGFNSKATFYRVLRAAQAEAASSTSPLWGVSKN